MILEFRANFVVSIQNVMCLMSKILRWLSRSSRVEGLSGDSISRDRWYYGLQVKIGTYRVIVFVLVT